MTASDVVCADSLTHLPTLDAGSVDVVITDPPYGLEFMGKEWDSPARMSGHNPTMTGGPAGRTSR